MAYAKNSRILFGDYNALVGTGTTANTFNAIWATGSSDSGYGQTPLPTVVSGTKIQASHWANLVTKLTSVANHQGTAISALTVPTVGGKIEYLSALPTNINSVYAARNAAAAQGTPIVTTTTNASTWSRSVTFTHTVTFASGDACRQFYNAGGQIKVSFSHPTGSGVNALFSTLAAACGTVAISAPASGRVRLAGTDYDGVSRVGGSGTVTTLSTNSGYHGLSSTPVVVFKQLATGTPAGYIGSFIQVSVSSNGTQGSNGDKGSVITITTLWDEIPDGGSTLVMSANTATTVTVIPPSTSYLSNSWGSITVAGSVTGS